ncbi:MAG: D-cysteine desulfhydrase family protein [Myxococcota bacterium]
MLAYPPRIELARLPTPVQPLARIGARLGVELLIKRDDLTGAELSGNKVRKLEFLLADALTRKADTLITCGGEQSNHARATALAAARLGMRSVLLLRTADPSRPPSPDGNILLDRMAGADIRWLTPDEYRRRTDAMARVAGELRAQGRRPYVIPEGGSNATGAWGYVAALEELCAQVPRPFTVIYACGSGGTGAGLLLGRALLLADDVRLVGVCVCDDAAYFRNVIGAILAELGHAAAPESIELIEGFVGRGYALSRPEELDRIVDAARTEGVILDPVYTGKAFHALATTLEADRHAFGPRVVFLHTGGIFGLLGKAPEVAARL